MADPTTLRRQLKLAEAEAVRWSKTAGDPRELPRSRDAALDRAAKSSLVARELRAQLEK